MNWKEHLFKPRWQHKDADVRLACVSNEQDPKLIDALLDIAASDPDSRVRCAAIARLHRLENILKLLKSETDPATRDVLRGRVRQLAGSTDESRPPLALRLQVIEQTTDKQLIEHLARQAPEARLRHAAIARVERQGLLGDCSIEDADADNRRYAASRIKQHTTLKRVIAGLRKYDKALHHQLQQRLHTELLEKADPGAVQIEALNICTALEKLTLGHSGDSAAETQALHSAWQGIANFTTADMTLRYQRVCKRLAAPAPKPTQSKPAKLHDPETTGLTETAPEPPPETTPEPAPEQVPDQALGDSLTRIRDYQEKNGERPVAKNLGVLRRRLEKTWTDITQPHPDDRAARDAGLAMLLTMEATLETQRRQSASDLEKARTTLQQLQQELDDGELHKALKSRALIQQLEPGRGQSAEQRKAWQTIHNQLQTMQARLRELRDWLHWSNDKIRKRLINEMKILPKADLHPDALLDLVKSLQTEWRALEASEQIPGDKHFSAAPWMWREFNAAGHAAFDTAKPFLEKRSEIQTRHAQSLAAFCEELEHLTRTQMPDWTALSKTINRGRRKMRGLNDIPARERQKYARKLKTALDEANGVMQTHYDAVEKDKLKLIRSASQLQHLEDQGEAVAAAKALQSQWKSAGSLWRGKEQKLWNEFRSHLDPLFAELKADQDSVRAADAEKLAKQKSLCEALGSILCEEDLPGQQGKVQGLHDQWKDIVNPNRRMLQSFQGMLQDYRQGVKKCHRQLQQTERERRRLKSGLLHKIVASDNDVKPTTKFKTRLSKSWPTESSTDAIEADMDQRFGAWLADDAEALQGHDLKTLTERAQALCIQLEFLAGLPSPESENQQRMQYQVDRLAESMSGGAPRPATSVEASAAEAAWLGMYALPEPAYSMFDQRIKSALNTIEENT